MVTGNVTDLRRKIKNIKIRNGSVVVHTTNSGVSIIAVRNNKKLRKLIAIDKTGKLLTPLKTSERITNWVGHRVPRCPCTYCWRSGTI